LLNEMEKESIKEAIKLPKEFVIMPKKSNKK
jgi:hypothetical protein